jgi:ABC-2 type transport system ATP-binding protein
LIGAPRADVDRVIGQVGLDGHADQTIGSLSGGEETRVSLAVSMLGSPELLVLDEPTVGLDPVLRAELWSLFRGIADGGATIIVSSHVMDEAIRCDRLLLMRAGRIIADTTPEGLLSETGMTDPDAAFLALVERDEAAAHSQAEPGHPLTRRELRETHEHDADGEGDAR